MTPKAAKTAKSAD